ncbi:hypothetical protein [Sporosarcina sp.]|uniref:hypothetical protein n=1 Tax=Sporosarcina sp. TaxID=49982 RepID=UPI002621AA8C|nr:hypothetical protein [Sporosarcina sp.]
MSMGEAMSTEQTCMILESSGMVTRLLDMSINFNGMSGSMGANRTCMINYICIHLHSTLNSI